MKPNIEFESLLTGIKDIKQRNKIFKGLSDEGKRLEIAWDVLQLLCNNTIAPSFGYYWSSQLTSKYVQLEHEYKDTSHSLFTAFNNTKNIDGCEVCARGAVMLCQIRLGNTINPSSVDAADASTGTFDILDGFSYESMLSMEDEYEESMYKHPYRSNSKAKLMNIMCNVLVNGDFNTEDKSDYLIL